MTYHMTCNWLLNSVIFDLFAMNSFTKWSSAMPPASKPRESWKINPGLLRNTSSFSMLCNLRREIVSSTQTIKGGFHTCNVGKTTDVSIWSWNSASATMEVCYRATSHLVPFAIEYLWLFWCVADLLKDGHPACIGSAYDEYTKAVNLLHNFIASTLGLWSQT
jgi:hypothetical protein